MFLEPHHADFGIRVRVCEVVDLHGTHVGAPVVVVEGNYLLLTHAPWNGLDTVFDATVFVSPPREAILNRLKERWITYGLDADAALARAMSNDLPNADLILCNSRTADLQLTQSETAAHEAY